MVVAVQNDTDNNNSNMEITDSPISKKQKVTHDIIADSDDDEIVLTASKVKEVELIDDKNNHNDAVLNVETEKSSDVEAVEVVGQLKEIGGKVSVDSDNENEEIQDHDPDLQAVEELSEIEEVSEGDDDPEEHLNEISDGDDDAEELPENVSEDEIQLNLDQQTGQILGVENFQPPKPADVYSNFINSEETEMLKKECMKVFTAKEADGEKYSSGSTFWFSIIEQPKTAIEQLVKRIFFHHAHLNSELVYNPMYSGAEWWTLVLDDDDDVGFHWDKDYELEEDHEMSVYPHVATVTYFSNIGAPTVILEHVGKFFSNVHSDLNVEPQSQEMFLSAPRVGKHLAFDGSLLHGAPSDWADVFPKVNNISAEKENNLSNKKRVTLLVNLWFNHKPLGADPLPEEIRKTLAKPISSSSGEAIPAANGSCSGCAGCAGRKITKDIVTKDVIGKYEIVEGDEDNFDVEIGDELKVSLPGIEKLQDLPENAHAAKVVAGEKLLRLSAVISSASKVVLLNAGGVSH